MKTIFSAFFLAVLVLFLASAPGAAQAPVDELVVKARAFIKALENNDFQAAAKDFDATMLKLSGPDKLAEFWKAAPAQFSPFKRQTAVRRDTLGAYDIVLVTCEFEKQTLDARVVFDKDGKIGGFQFIPSLPPARYEPPAYADASRFGESEVTVGAGEWALPGTLTMPVGEGPFPALVVVHGSGPNDRDESIGPNKPFKDLAWGLASRGIAVLRYDKRSKVYGAKIVKDARLPLLTVKEETIDDAVEAVRLLKKTPRIDGLRIFVLGHSLGGMLIPRIALAAKELAPAGFISMAGLTRKMEDTIIQQMTYIYALGGQISADETRQIEALKVQAAQVKALKDSERGAAEPMIFNAPPAYWLDLRGYYPPETAKSMDRPFLILQGARDYQVTTEDFDNWKKALEGRPGVEFHLYPKCNHLFFEGEGAPSPIEYQLKHGSVAPQVVGDIAAFILKNRSGLRARRPSPGFLIGAVLAAGAISAAGMRPAQAPSASPEAKTLIIRGVRLFDGDRVFSAADVIVRGGRIVSAGPAGAAIPADAEIVDGTGKTLLPGLIDAHVHVWTVDNLKQCLAFGVTAVIDMFMNTEAMKAIKAEQSSAAPPLQAYLVSPGILCTVPGGHGTQFGIAIPTIAAETDLQAFVDARIAEGADFIKLIQDDFSAYGMKRPTLTNAQVAGLVQAAHRRGKIAVIHAATLQNCEDALNAGVDGLAHLFFENRSDPDFSALAARRKAFVIPTLSVLRAMNGPGPAPGLLDDPDLKPYLKPDDTAGFKSRSTAVTAAGSYEAAEAALRQLPAAGVPLLAGTDTPNPGTAFGAALHSELELLVTAGLTPIEALRAATSVPAEKFAMTGRGRIRPGAAADLVLVDGDPTVSIKATRRIVAVWKGGRPVDREAYRAGVAEAVRAAQNIPVAGYGPSGLIADFEDGKLTAAFGSGWMVSTDAFGGGKSTAVMDWAAGGAQDSRGAMKISGEIKEGPAFAWAGAAFSPGTSPMAPANLGAKKGVSFWAKGTARTCAIEFFARSRGFRPVAKTFTVGSDWKEYAVTFEELGLDGTDIMMIFFGAVNDPGPFTLWIDEIRLK